MEIKYTGITLACALIKMAISKDFNSKEMQHSINISKHNYIIS